MIKDEDLYKYKLARGITAEYQKFLNALSCLKWLLFVSVRDWTIPSVWLTPQDERETPVWKCNYHFFRKRCADFLSRVLLIISSMLFLTITKPLEDSLCGWHPLGPPQEPQKSLTYWNYRLFISPAGLRLCWCRIVYIYLEPHLALLNICLLRILSSTSYKVLPKFFEQACEIVSSIILRLTDQQQMFVQVF